MKFSLAVLKSSPVIKFDSLFYFIVNNAILEGAQEQLFNDTEESLAKGLPRDYSTKCNKENTC